MVIKAVNEFSDKHGFVIHHDEPMKLRETPPNPFFTYEDCCDWWIDLSEKKT